MKNKITVLLPDGVGLRNFVYTDFLKVAKNEFDVTLWNNTPYSENIDGVKVVEYPKSRLNPKTDILKGIRKELELKLYENKFSDQRYTKYLFKAKYASFKSLIKYIWKSLLWLSYDINDKSQIKMSKEIQKSERKSELYKDCYNFLSENKTDFLFSTNQRHISALPAIIAAKDLGIPTATFIFSWDNLPKATMVLDTDYYFVWSERMKNELKTYYPYIKDEQIYITGTTQFEPYFDESLVLSKEDFFKNEGLDTNYDYICYSGDDVTTSPNDPYYLEDCVKSVKRLNDNEHHLKILFRPCPVDFSDRYDKVLNKYKDIIHLSRPKWRNDLGNGWAAALPTKEDLILLTNVVKHTKTVINVGSTMAIDYAINGKVSCYLNYNTKQKNDENWDINKIYKYIHFESMNGLDPVYWINSEEDFEVKILEAISDKHNRITDATKWADKICISPKNKASDNIVNSIKQILGQK